MKQTVSIEIGEINVKGVKVAGGRVEASYEASAEEIGAQADAWSKVLDKVEDKFGWLFAAAKKALESDVQLHVAYNDRSL